MSKKKKESSVVDEAVEDVAEVDSAISTDEEIEIASTTYGTKFPSIVGKDNIYGTQFHPEKSDKMGMQIIQNFVDICRR